MERIWSLLLGDPLVTIAACSANFLTSSLCPCGKSRAEAAKKETRRFRQLLVASFRGKRADLLLAMYVECGDLVDYSGQSNGGSPPAKLVSEDFPLHSDDLEYVESRYPGKAIEPRSNEQLARGRHLSGLKRPSAGMRMAHGAR
jgi:hypothetical protein